MRKERYTIRKLVFITIVMGCVMFAVSVFISNYVFHKVTSMMYLDYLEKNYEDFGSYCRNFLLEEGTLRSCEESRKEKRATASLSYLLKNIEIKYGTTARLIGVNWEGEILFATEEERINSHLKSFLKIMSNKSKNAEEINTSLYGLKSTQMESVYTCRIQEGLTLHLFVEKPIWERVFPEYRFDGIIMGRNGNVIMTSREGFIDHAMKIRQGESPFDRDYTISRKVLDRGEITICSMVYAPTDRKLLYVGFILVVVFGGFWSFAIIKAYERTMREDMRDREELLKRNYIAEIRELTAQINPHFMYNTLEMIKYMIIQDGVLARKLIEKFTKILRYSISNTEREISLEEDLSYLKDYLSIQEERFRDRLLCKFQISEEAKKCRVMKLALQPMIENSIKYGFKNNMRLEILIEGRKEDNYLFLRVKDSGGGMEEKSLKELRKKIEGDEIDHEHNGIHNIARRLQLKYKGHSGIRINNVDGGFEVILYIRQEVEDVSCTGRRG